MYIIKSTFVLLFTLLPTDTFAHKLILAPGKKISEGEVIMYEDCELRLQKDGNLVTTKNGKTAWASEGKVHESSENTFFAKLKQTGDLIIKSKNQSPVFKTYSGGKGFMKDSGGGLFFEKDCTITIAKDSSTDFVWANVRSKLHSGNRLRKGEMFHYPEHDPKFTLALQHDGNLVIFRGADRSDFNGPDDIVFSAHAFSHKEEFYLEVTCDGYLVLKERVNADSRKHIVYWSLRLVEESGLKKGGYSVTLSEHGFDYVEEDGCEEDYFTA